jgi:hypothetical protein
VTEYAGNIAYIKFGSTVLSPDYRAFSEEETLDIKDASAGSDGYKPKVTTQKDGKSSITLVAQAAGTALWAAVALGTEGTLEWGPEGTVSGKPRHYVTAIVSKRGQPLKYDEVAMLDIDFAYNSVVTDTAY